MTELELLIAYELAFGTHLRCDHIVFCGSEIEAVDCVRAKEHIDSAKQAADDYIRLLTNG